jgi:hypothetical protein
MLAMTLSIFAATRTFSRTIADIEARPKAAQDALASSR